MGPFDRFCTEQGIKHKKTVPKTPHENGIAERMNQTIVERIRCMLRHSKLLLEREEREDITKERILPRS